ncbi:alternative oxidase-domain-containing protein [Crucibulum laeve]|uniref:Alternative oxidase n=1 Tax=Crucibulum laeve TaxID=68775 RepID=A0A5C3M5A9_9AGAR|nr:alternative oxidase-domain-containing protein [Crucibulum laeve]
MIRTSAIRATPFLYQPSTLRLSGTSFLNNASCRRTFISSAARCKDEALLNKDSHKKATEAHKQDMPGSSSAATSELTKPDAVSTVPREMHGDWVLFHPVYTPDELKQVEVLHRATKTFSDKLAYGLVKFTRASFDFVSRYKHVEGPPDPNMSLEQLRKAGYMLSDRQWLHRILFLESIAGVPGMVAATLRHLQSLRLMRRDSGWIHTCLEEAENERMHLMTFMTLRKPSIFFRALVLGAQGVFYNLFFLSYIFSPKTCHRFVGHLEEEAVLTYTRCIADLEAGRLPEWSNKPAPEIAIDYWRLPADAKLIDVLYAVRSDETTHRFVNHSLANLNPSTDVNPFALREPDMHTKGHKIAFDRSESAEYVKQSHELLQKKMQASHE